MPNQSYHERMAAKIEAIKAREKDYREGKLKDLFDSEEIHKRTLKKMERANEMRSATHAYHDKPGEPEPVTYEEARKWVMDELKYSAKVRRDGDRERKRVARGGRARSYPLVGQGR